MYYFLENSIANNLQPEITRITNVHKQLEHLMYKIITVESSR